MVLFSAACFGPQWKEISESRNVLGFKYILSCILLGQCKIYLPLLRIFFLPNMANTLECYLLYLCAWGSFAMHECD